MAWLSINSISCVNTIVAVGEIYVTVGLDSNASERIWGPRDINDGESFEVNWPSPDDSNEFSNSALVQIWEQRLSGGHDSLIGSIHIPAVPVVRQTIVATWYRRAMYRISYDVSTEERGVLQWPIRLNRLHCNDAKGARDDVYLLWNGRLIWGPVRMRTGDWQLINHTIVIRDQGTLSLWEQDSRNSDHLGTHVLHSEEESRPDGPVPGEKPLEFRWRESDRRDSFYTLYYED